MSVVGVNEEDLCKYAVSGKKLPSNHLDGYRIPGSKMQNNKYRENVTDLDIQALADGQCKEEEKTRIIDAVMSSPTALARLDEILQQNDLLKAWWNFVRKD